MKTNKITTCLIISLLCSVSSLSLAQVTKVGSVTSVLPIGHNQHPQLMRYGFGLSTLGVLEITPYAPDVVRVRYHWDGLWEKEEIAIDKQVSEWPGFTVNARDEGNIYIIETPELIIEVVKTPHVQVHFKSPQGFYLSRDVQMEYNPQYNPISDPSYNNIRYEQRLPNGFKLKATREAPGGEAYFGLGEYAGPANRRGKTIQGWNSDTFSWGWGWTPMYMTMPFFYGTKPATTQHPSYAYGVFFNNPARPVFHMASQSPDRYSFEAADGKIDYYFFSGGSRHEMRKVLHRYTELTGAPTKLPKWAYGYHMSRWSYSNQAWIQWLTQEFRNRDFPLDAVYLDLDYFDVKPDDYYYDNSLHQLTFNQNFPNPAGMIQHSANRGVKLVPIIEAWLTRNDPKFNDALGQRHFIKDYNYQQLITPIYFGDVGWLDFSSSSTRNWWKGKLVNFLNQYPLAGMWNDLNEPADNGAIPLNGQYSVDGRYPAQFDSRKFHLNEKNIYNIRETSLTYEALLQKYPNQRPFVLSRAGYPGIQRYALGWSGDNVASWDHCRFNIGLGVSVMMSGQANFGHDVGGFVNSTTGELLTRWHEWAAFNPFFRNHSTKWDSEREPWRFGEYYGGLLRNIIKLRYQMMPYLYSLAHQSTVDGTPMNTPTVMHFQQDPGTHWLNDNDFMVGDYLLASPIFNPGQTRRVTYLPLGTDWYNWHNGAKHTGGRDATQEAPLGTLPLYARAGAIIPMGPPMTHVNQFAPDFLDVHIFPVPAGFSSRFTMHEDDGETFDFLSGEFARTTFEQIHREGSLSLVTHPREGNFDPGQRHLVFKIRDIGNPGRILVDGVPVSVDQTLATSRSYRYDRAARFLTIKIPDQAAGSIIDVELNQDYSPVEWIGRITTTPTNGAIRPEDNLCISAQSSPQGAATAADVVFTVDQGLTWITNALTRTGTGGSNDLWNGCIGDFESGTPVWFRIQTRDARGQTFINSNNGTYHRVTTGVLGPELVWIGGSYHWPTDGNIKPTDNLWINTFTYPQKAATRAELLFTTDGGQSWSTNAMVRSGVNGNDDWWNINLGSFSNRTRVFYMVRASDTRGNTLNDHNGSKLYSATVGTPALALVWAGNPDQYPGNGSIKSTDNLWVNVETWPRTSAIKTDVILSTNAGITWITNTMNLAGTRSGGANDWWNRNLGTFTNGTRVWYWMRATDANEGTKEVKNNGSHFVVTVGTAAPALAWAGNIDQYPGNGWLFNNQDLWLNLESWPKTAAASVKLMYGTNPNGPFSSRLLALAGTRSNGVNDWWNLNIGRQAAGTVYYYFEVSDHNGKLMRVPATGVRQAVIKATAPRPAASSGKVRPANRVGARVP